MKSGITKSEKAGAFAYFIEILGWLQIVASPLLVAGAIGFIVYISKPTDFRLLVGAGIAALGFIIGIIWATNIWRKKGTIHFVSRIMASPELDPPEPSSKEKD